MARSSARTVAAVTIAGLDPSGGAGIAADLRAFSAAGAWGCAVCAAVTVQSTRGLRAIVPTPPALLVAQLDELAADVRLRAIKTGALGSIDNVRAVARYLGAHPQVPAVVDPVMLPSRTRGRPARLDGGASSRMFDLARVARLVTPNIDEASALLSTTVTEKNARDAAAALVSVGLCAVLLKGGHGTSSQAIDWFATRRCVVPIARRRLRGASPHGTGCTLAALIAGRLATLPRAGRVNDDELLRAIRWARTHLERALRRPLTLGAGSPVLKV